MHRQIDKHTDSTDKHKDCVHLVECLLLLPGLYTSCVQSSDDFSVYVHMYVAT